MLLHLRVNSVVNVIVVYFSVFSVHDPYGWWMLGSYYYFDTVLLRFVSAVNMSVIYTIAMIKSFSSVCKLIILYMYVR